MLNGITLRKQDKEGNIQHRPGIELTFSCPKSISIEWDVLQKKGNNIKLEEVSAAAVHRVLGYIEDRGMVYSRDEDSSNSRVPTHKLIFALFKHNMYSEVESYIHTRCFLFNATKCSDGIYREIVWDSLLKNIKYLGQMYRVELTIVLGKLGVRLSKPLEKERSALDIEGNTSNA